MKRKGRKKTAVVPTSYSSSDEEHSYFRLCHLCLYLNEGNSEVLQCARCQHALSAQPVNEQERLEDELMEDDDSQDEEEDAGGSFRGFRRRASTRLTGLSVVW